MEHRLVVEADIGRYLRPDEFVHHIDGDHRNNARANLAVMSKEAHDALHSELRRGQSRGASAAALIAQQRSHNIHD